MGSTVCDRIDALEGRLTSLVKAVEGFAQDNLSMGYRIDEMSKDVNFLQERQDVMTRDQLRQSERLNAIQSWMNVTDKDLGIDVEPGKFEHKELSLPERDLDCGLFTRPVGKPFSNLKKDWPPERHEKVAGLADEAMEDMLKQRAQVRQTIPATRTPEVYVRDETHGQHPRKVVVYLE